MEMPPPLILGDRRPIEETLGRRIEPKRGIPGAPPGDPDKVRYVSFSKLQNPSTLFNDVVWKLIPPAAKHGGVVLEGCIVTTPDCTAFFSLSYHGDVVGWKEQIGHGARELGLYLAKVELDRFVLFDGRSYALAECAVEFD